MVWEGGMYLHPHFPVSQRSRTEVGLDVYRAKGSIDVVVTTHHTYIKSIAPSAPDAILSSLITDNFIIA